jgi:hypothetical protein
LDPERTRALSDFYRQEFELHLQRLQGIGILSDEKGAEVRCACDRFLKDLDRIAWRSDFKAMAEVLLERFNTLSRLHELDPRSGH